MSIASEITRLQQAKNDLATSITNKGVTVSAATTIDGYAALVDQIQGGGGSQPYKTITLADSHESDSKGNPSYWANYLGLPLLSDSSDRNLYIIVFEGNQATANYRVDFALYFRYSSTIGCLSIRNNRTNYMSQYGTSRSLWASTGTVLKAYEIPTI